MTRPFSAAAPASRQPACRMIAIAAEAMPKLITLAMLA
jgi:hypothetical protein